jgi:hypothetical protein
MARLCEVCGAAITGPGAPGRSASRCRIARWRRTRADETAITVTQLFTETAALRQRVAEFERQVGHSWLSTTPSRSAAVSSSIQRRSSKTTQAG